MIDSLFDRVSNDILELENG